VEIGSVLRRAGDGVERYGLRAFAGRAAVRGLRPLLTPLAARRLRRRARAAGDLDALVELAYACDELGVQIRPGQVRSEIRGLLRLLEPRGCRRILEIGTQHGGSLFLLAHVADPEALLVSVDLPHGEFGGGYPCWRAPLYRRFGQARQRIELIRGDSHADATRARVADVLGGELLDFLFIDGDHTYDGVKRDFELYRDLVRPGGLVAFHDITPGSAEGDGAQEVETSRLLSGEVPRFWAEVRERFPTTELAGSELGFYGIGLVYL
jgi:predicted O-methyltransferase YrrM